MTFGKGKVGGQSDLDDPRKRALWAYAAGLTDEKPGAQKVETRETREKRWMNPADMAFNTLVDYFRDGGTARNWVFPMDMHGFGLVRRQGGLTKAEREQRGRKR